MRASQDYQQRERADLGRFCCGCTGTYTSAPHEEGQHVSETRAAWALERRIAYPSIQEVAPSPDGRHVVYVARRPLMAEDRSEFVSHIFLAPAESAPPAEAVQPLQLTRGEHRNHGAQWSPDGRY